MNKSDYDKYYKKGGTYVIPVELFNELFDELERLSFNYGQALEDLDKKDNIINELEKILINNKLYGEDVYKKSKLTKEQFKKEYPYTLGSYQNSTYLLLKLQELKGSDKE